MLAHSLGLLAGTLAQQLARGYNMTPELVIQEVAAAVSAAMYILGEDE